MKVLQINSVYDYGSTGKIVADIHKMLPQFGVQSVVCYGRRQKSTEQNVYQLCDDFYSHIQHFRANVTGVMYGGCALSTYRLLEIIKSEKPDVVHLQCLNNYFVNIYKLVNWLKINKIPTVLTLHAEFMYTGGCGYSIDCNQWSNRTGCGHSICPRYRSELKSMMGDKSGYMWRKMKDAFDGFDDNLMVVSVSPWLMERAKKSPILAEKQHCVVLNGVDTAVFKPYGTQELRKKYSCENNKVVLHVTPGFSADPNHIKGGYYVIELAKKMPEAMFIVAGDCVGDVSVPDNVTLLGKVTDQKKLAQLYSMADVTLLTSKRETFSMVCAESLCCGTPVVGFKAGAPEQISIEEFSTFVEYGNVTQLQYQLMELLHRHLDAKKIETLAHERYAQATMVENYVAKYIELLREHGV
ncbi:glycosyltransferase [Pygmaiobacter massiliensis]|uniref:glycosyltransferase n=1 Tax=Pygmaiobacter massiliensis TaxID=1917873 RepID=UPI000C7D8718|nr:glycosyltransferase [Pygmaiobacter massiliensis]